MKKVKEGYKMTELGEIPEEWEIKRLEDICEFLDDKRKPIKAEVRLLMQGNIPYYGASGIIDWVNDYLFDDKLILLGEDGENIKSRNIPLAFRVTGKCWVNNHAHVLKIKNNKRDDIDYITYSLENKDYSSYVIGSAQPKLNQAVCKEIPLLRPKANEQQKIASILSSADEQIEITDNLIEKMKELKKGLMQRLLTKGIGHSRFKDTEIGRIPEEWEVRKLSEVADIIMGQSPDSSSYNTEAKGIPFFQGKTEFGAIYPIVKKWCTKPTKIANPLDILISVRAPVGDVNINNIESCIGRGLGAIRQTDKSYFKYIYYILQAYQNELKKFSQGSTFEAINSSDLKELKIPVPPLQEQQQIASILSSVDNQISQYESKKEKLQELKKGLMQKLLTGKIRVKVS